MVSNIFRFLPIFPKGTQLFHFRQHWHWQKLVTMRLPPTHNIRPVLLFISLFEGCLNSCTVRQMWALCYRQSRVDFSDTNNGVESLNNRSKREEKSNGKLIPIPEAVKVIFNYKYYIEIREILSFNLNITRARLSWNDIKVRNGNLIRNP